MSTYYVIYIHTNEKEYQESWYSLLEAIDRVDILEHCDNVNYIDIVDTCTGEVMITVKGNKVEYVATDVPVRMYNEVLLNQ